MKPLVVTALMILLCLQNNAQEKEQEKRFYYSEVVHVDGASKSELYQRALEWVTSTFNTPKSAIQIQDKEAGNIVCKGSFDIPLPAEDYVFFTFRIIVKDGRYKYILKDMYHEGTYNHGRTRNAGALVDDKPDCGRAHMAMWYWRKIKAKAELRAKALVASAIDGMNKKSEIEDF